MGTAWRDSLRARGDTRAAARRGAKRRRRRQAEIVSAWDKRKRAALASHPNCISKGMMAEARPTNAAARAGSERRVEERTELLRARRMAQLAERFRLDLADAFAGHVERAADFFERVLGAVADAEAHLEDLLLARGERAQDFVRLLFQVRNDHVINRRDHAAIFDEIAEVRIFLFADRRFERDRLLRDLHDLAHFRDRHVHPLSDLLGLRFAAELLHERARCPRELV